MPRIPVSARPILVDRLILAFAVALVVAVALVHVDKFRLGVDGPQRAHDGGDYVLTTLRGCGQHWRDPSALWDATVARGWPSLYGAFPPQHPGCFAAAFLPTPIVWPLLQVLIVATLAVGTLLFFRLTLGYTHMAAFAGALFQVGLFYWFHENDLATSATLLLPLIGFLSVRGGLAAFVIGFAGLLAILALAGPVGTLILMPTMHLLLVLAVVPGFDRRRHLWLFLGFWAAYGLFYVPTVVGYVMNAGHASRAFFAASRGSESFWYYVRDFTLNISVVTSGLVLLAFVDRKTWRGTLLAAGVVATIIAFVSLNQLYVVRGAAVDHPWMLGMSTMYYRVYYMIAVVVCLWGGYLLQRADGERRLRAVARRLVLVGVIAAGGGYLLKSGYFLWPSYAAWIGVCLAILPRLRVRDVLAATAVAAIVILPLRGWFTEGWESPLQGNVFIEGPPAESDSTARVVTVMRTCDASDIFPAQAAIQGRETLDGISNLYHADVVRRWQYFVTNGSTGCTKRYARWNTRIEVTPEDMARDPERILLWFWVNGVDELRGTAPLTHPDLRLIEAKPIIIHWHGQVMRHRYALREPLSRVFQLPAGVALPTSLDDYSGEEALLRSLRTTSRPTPVTLESYTPSRYVFNGDFGGGQILISTNVHSGWKLRVDGEPSAALSRGPFGMLAITPSPGRHRYEVVFSDGFWWPTVIAMGLGILSLGALVHRARRVPGPPSEGGVFGWPRERAAT